MVMLPASLFAQCKLDYSNYKVVFVDNFDTYTNVSQLDAKWERVDPKYPLNGVGAEYYSPNQVSLQPGGVVRLTAQKLTTPLYDYSGTNPRKISYVSGKLDVRPILDNIEPPGNANSWNPGGIAYGIFEIRCKLPVENNGTWPTFWLYSGPGEIDIIDNLLTNPARQLQTGVLDWGNYTRPVITCGTVANKLNWDDLAAGFNTYSAVWTPTRVTFFFNGREMYTVYNTQVSPGGGWPAKLMTRLQMADWAGQSAVMDIDYIRILKPKDYVSNGMQNNVYPGDYNVSYKSSSEFINHSITIEAAALPNVNSAAGSIGPNPTNPNEVFYRSSENRMCRALKGSNNQWIIETLPVSNANELVKGDVTFNAGFITYRGNDNRVQYYSF